MHCQLTLKRLDQDQAILTNAQEQEFIWPSNQLPADSQVGSVFSCVLVNPGQLDEADRSLAKDMLNELLKVA